MTPFFKNTKIRNLIIVLALGVLGYWLGPGELPAGEYAAQITVTIDGQSLSVEYPFELGEDAGQIYQSTYEAGAYQIVIAGQDRFRTQLDDSIAYKVQVLDPLGAPVQLALDEATSTITGENYSQPLPATNRKGDWLEFTMRIPYKAKISTALLFAVAALWITELVPLAAASLLVPVVMVTASVTDPGIVLQPFFHPIVVLFFAGFLLAEAMHRTEVDRIIALNILNHTSLEPAFLMITMMALTAFLSMWMSNTASVAIIIPIALAVLGRIPGEITQTGFRRALILGVAYAATIGGIGSAIGTPANILALTYLNDLTGTQMGFVDWFRFGLPMVIVMVPIIWVYLLLVFRVKLHHIGPHLSRQTYDNELKDLGKLRKDQLLLILVFSAVFCLWLTDRWHQVHASIVALGGVLILFFTETIKKEDLSRINWDALLTFGGGLALGNMLLMTGVSDWIALHLIGLVDLPLLVVVFLVASLTLLIGAFISNTACAAMLIPLAIPLAQILYLDPRLLVAVIAIASSIDFALVVGTPPTMMAYSTGLFTTKEIFKRGAVLDIIGIAILCLVAVWIWRWLGIITI